MSKFDTIIADSQTFTVVSKYEAAPTTRTDYQTEAQLEDGLIAKLVRNGYDRLDGVRTVEELYGNLRTQLELLNGIEFSDMEWERFRAQRIDYREQGVDDCVMKSIILQRPGKETEPFTFDDGHIANLKLIDKKNIHNNRLQVLNQLREESTGKKSRYDVTILVNGLPLVHIELKKRGVLLKKAWNQINRYQNEAFWGSGGLFEFVQIFVISNGTLTRYYSNSTRDDAVKFNANISGRYVKTRQGDSYKFTSVWADAENRHINDLMDFANTFLTKATLLNILTKYCVLDSKKMLLVMRPYQIASTERVIQRISTAALHGWFGTKRACGYIWHTTGSGKTLESFKTSQLACNLSGVNKVLFVVDRKDLDAQTVIEYDRFQKGCVSTTSTADNLRKKLDSNLEEDKVIVTTIQKLAAMIRRDKKTKGKSRPAFYEQNTVFIFDECQRSQFGKMHQDIKNAFKKYALIGYTGTPIFTENANQNHMTTEHIFGECFHRYNIVSAINDENVLGFNVLINNTIKENEDIADVEVSAIDEAGALESDKRIEAISEYVINNFDRYTYRNKQYKYRTHLYNGFNAIFAADGIPAAIKYYHAMQKINNTLPPDKRLNIAIIYSARESDEYENSTIDIKDMPVDQQQALQDAIADYNKIFSTHFDLSTRDNYYQDLMLRTKRDWSTHQGGFIDLVIVVNMMLTGFDAPMLNTVFIDKNLRYHALLQTMSRTNRILNEQKQSGNIVCFRNLEDEIKDSLRLFGGDDANEIAIIRSYDEYMQGWDDDDGNHHDGYREVINILLNEYPLPCEILGEAAEKKFIGAFNKMLRIRNILYVNDKFHNEDGTTNDLLTEAQRQDYQSIYLDLSDKYASKHDISEDEPESFIDDVVFEIELVKQIEVSIDYILSLIETYTQEPDENKPRREVLIDEITAKVAASPTLRSKVELIRRFIENLNFDGAVDISTAWVELLDAEMKADLLTICSQYALDYEKTEALMRRFFDDGFTREGGGYTGIFKNKPRIGAPKKGTEDTLFNRMDAKEALERYYQKYVEISCW